MASTTRVLTRSRRRLAALGGVATVVLLVAARERRHEAPGGAPLAAAHADERLVAEVRSILAANCFTCHGPDEATRQAGLRLDLPKDQQRDLGEGTRAVVPGDPLASEALRRILEGDPELRMPPPEVSPHGLDEAEVATIRAWIEAGAPWAEHWSLRPPVAEPARPLREVIDAEVAAGLASALLRAGPRADPAAQLRRVSLDLIGLPPSVAEVESFLADPSDAAYARAVDRLLASPRFGERWARWWLDLARYADSKGYEKDDLRTAWPYRDWVIRALDRDLPLDRFATEQLAGDLLPDASDETRLATSFHRQTMNNDEGGTSDEEFRVAAVVDRVNTTMEVFQGLTAACAQCHTHKFDPITHEEYYRLLAIFDQTADADTPDEKPTLPVEVRLDWMTEPMRVEVPVLAALPAESRRETRILRRGSFLDRGEVVSPGVPAAILAEDQAHPGDRLELARFLFDPRNPLTARVLANRVWAELFGAGIVETLEDLGVQGAPPSHPRLLDALAIGLREGGWSLKRLLREVVSSETYRRSADLSPSMREVDPRDRLLGRFPRHRLDAETIRDSALAAAGLLSDRMHGPPVFPPQPEGVWTVIYSDRGWTTSEGEDRHRRAIYTHWRRTVPYPSMMAFDATSRETCTSRRSRTNSPLQALVMLNDPVFVECGQALARRAIEESSDDAGRAERLFLRALARRPSSAETAEILALVEDRRMAYAGSPEEDALRTATVPLGPLPEGLPAVEAAAWTIAASAILNLDEFLVKP